MYESRFTVLRVRGIPIGVSWSWAFVAAFLTWSLTADIFPNRYAGLSSWTYLAMGIASALLFFVSIVLHELGHAFRAIKEGMRIEGITLWLFGGVARFLGMFPSAGAELRIAIAGPLVSALLFGLFATLIAVGDPLGLPLAVRAVVEYLAGINLLIFAFNLVPALPLDGGRILRALLWKRRGDFASATRSAARLGQAFGFLLVAGGVWLVSRGQVTTGLWISVLGIFIVQAAKAEAAVGSADTALGGSRVRDLMTPAPGALGPETTIADLLERAAIGTTGVGGVLAYPVATNGRFLGLISLQRAGSVPVEERAQSTVGDTMTAAEMVAVLSPETPALEALEALRRTTEPAVVTEDGRITSPLAGMVSMVDVARALQAELSRQVGRSRVTRTGVAWGMVGVVTALLAVGLVYHPPFYVLSPGPASDVSHDMTITGVPTRVPTARYLLTTVRAEQYSVLQDLIEAFRPHRQLIASSQIGSPAFQEQLFKESQVLAAVAAGRAKGLQVVLTGSGAEVTDLVAGSPAAKALRRGDVVVAVDGNPVHTTVDLHDAIAAKPAGTGFDLTLQRDGKTIATSVTSARIAAGGQRGAIGAQLVTKDIEIAAPFHITFTSRPIGGPSAGLAYALAISDALGNTDPGQSQTIAATGAIDADGTVSDVGGVELKALGAKAEGAKLFLVPADEVNAARGLIGVRGVTSLTDALAILRQQS